jgi:hypothetical protein
MADGEIYKSGITEPWLRCITSKKGKELLKKIHSGFCGAHIRTRALAGKAIKQGFFRPLINVDAKKLVVRNRMPVSLRGGGGELGKLKP